MAEVAMSMVIDKLIALLSEDVEMLRGIHKEVEDIKVELEFIICFLKVFFNHFDLIVFFLTKRFKTFFLTI